MRRSVVGSVVTYILFSLARIAAYLAVALAVFFLGRFLAGQYLGAASKYVLLIGGGFVIYAGVLLILGRGGHKGRCRLPQDKNAIILGLIIGLLPCAPLLAAFSYIGLASKSWLASTGYALSFGLGTLLSPLLLLCAGAGLLPRLMKGQNALYERAFNLFCGGIMVFLGAQLIRRGFY